MYQIAVVFQVQTLRCIGQPAAQGNKAFPVQRCRIRRQDASPHGLRHLAVQVVTVLGGVLGCLQSGVVARGVRVPLLSLRACHLGDTHGRVIVKPHAVPPHIYPERPFVPVRRLQIAALVPVVPSMGDVKAVRVQAPYGLVVLALDLVALPVQENGNPEVCPSIDGSDGVNVRVVLVRRRVVCNLDGPKPAQHSPQERPPLCQPVPPLRELRQGVPQLVPRHVLDCQRQEQQRSLRVFGLYSLQNPDKPGRHLPRFPVRAQGAQPQMAGVERLQRPLVPGLVGQVLQPGRAAHHPVGVLVVVRGPVERRHGQRLLFLLPPLVFAVPQRRDVMPETVPV